MKKKLLILLVALILIPFKVFATGGFSVSTTYISMYPGDSKTITISSSNAVGKINVYSNNTGVATVNTGSIFIQTPGSGESITITAKEVGSTTVNVVATESFATLDEEILTGVTKTITVNVVNRPVYVAKSSNNNFKDFNIEGYDLEKVDDNNYKLTVSNSVSKIKINASAEDSKANVEGFGEYELNVGENIIDVIVTSESGVKNVRTIVITRKDGYYLEDLNEVLNNNITDINIGFDSKITKDELDKIKEKGSLINFNYYDDNKVLQYSWTIDGSKIKDSSEILLGITNTSDDDLEISKLSNYASGIYLNFSYEGELPENTKIKYYVGNYNNGDTLNLYYYNKTTNNLELAYDNLVVEDGFVTFDLDHCSTYFMTMSTISNVVVNSYNNTSNSFNWFIVISIIEFILLVLCILYYFLKLRVKKDDILIIEEKVNNINTNNEKEKINVNNEITYDSSIDNNDAV